MSCHLLFIQLFSSIAASVSIKLLFCSVLFYHAFTDGLHVISQNATTQLIGLIVLDLLSTPASASQAFVENFSVGGLI